MAGLVVTLDAYLRQRIKRFGPIPIPEAMRLALHDPRFGYYANQDPIGAQGDFITAPEIHAGFGQAVGCWVYNTWLALGRPAPFALVELGPGTGQLMADLWSVLPQDCQAAAKVVLCDINPVLRARQAEALSHIESLRWVTHWGELPGGEVPGAELPGGEVPGGDVPGAEVPMILIGNEFLDALAIEQLVAYDNRWYQRCVGLVDGQLAFVRGPVFRRPLPPGLQQAPEAGLLEIPTDAMALIDFLIREFRRHAGAALFLDYGADRLELGDTLQAVKAHTKCAVLDTLGQADLTAHVGFPWLGLAADQAGGDADGPMSQAAFLKAFAPLQADENETAKAAWQRLIAPQAMGSLFKAMAFRAKSCPALLPPMRHKKDTP